MWPAIKSPLTKKDREGRDRVLDDHEIAAIWHACVEAFRARGVLIGSAASISITHLTPFNQHRLTLCRPYFLTRDKNAKLIKES